MKIKNLIEGLNDQQRSVPQLPAQARARKISVLGAKTDPQHPFAGYAVGASESEEFERKRIGPDENDPYEKGWRAGFRQNEFNPYPTGSAKAEKWEDGYAEARAQPNHYDEGIEANMPDLQTVGEPVGSLMDAERRMAAGDRIFVAHEMDEEPFEIFNMDDLSGYTYDQMLAVPQDVAEDKLNEKCWDGYHKQGMKKKGNRSVPNCVKNEGAERNEMDTPAVQAALARMAERHKGEKWSKEQLAALGKRIAARGQNKKDVREGEITRTPTGLIHKGKYGTSHYDTTSDRDDVAKAKVGRPPKSAGRDVSIDEPRQIRRNQPGYMNKSPRITNPDAPRSPVRKTGPIAGGGLGIDLPKHVQDRIFAQSDFDRIKANPGIMRVKPKDDGVAILDLDEGLKSKIAAAALAGAAALGGGAAAAHDHGDYGHYDQRLDDRSWDTAGYDDHIKSDTKLTKTTTPDGQVKRDLQDRISSVQGPNAQGLYRVFVGQNGKIVSSYITKTPPQNWMVKKDVTKEDIITKLKARLGDYFSDIGKEIKKDPDLIDKLAAKAPGDQMGPPVKTVATDDGHEISIHGNEADGFHISIKNKPMATRFENLDEAVMACEMYCARRRSQAESADYIDEAGKDACYHKVKSRYKIWPSAYGSGALVRCRKVGAANWGNKSKK